MTPCRGNAILYSSSQQLPRLCLCLEGLFELTRRPSQALDSPRALLPELKRYKDTFRCVTLGTNKCTRIPLNTMQTMIACVRLLKLTFSQFSLVAKRKPQENIGVCDQTWDLLKGVMVGSLLPQATSGRPELRGQSSTFLLPTTQMSRRETQTGFAMTSRQCPN